MSQYTTRKQIYISYVAAWCRERRRVFPERTFFLSVSVRSRTRHETLTCHVHARCYTALCFQPLLFPHVWWRELKDTLTARLFRKRRRADWQHELQQSSRGFRLGFDRLRDKDREPHTCHVHAKGQQRTLCTALMFAGAIRQSPAQLTWARCKCKATLTNGKLHDDCAKT